MKNIHILSTDKPSQLFHYIERPDKFFIDLKRERLPVPTVIHKNIYITSDEEIKQGNWGYSEMDGIGIWNGPILIHEGLPKKIILTTDQDLIKDGVQAIDDEFLEWFVKNPSCEEVEVIHITRDWNEFKRTIDFYKIIIPKKITRCCGRCNGVDDICYSDMTCNVHKALGCEECYGKRVEYKSSQQIIDEDLSGGLDMGQIIPKEDNHNYLPGFIQQFNPEEGELNNKDWSAVDFLKWLELNKFKIIK